MMKTVSCFSVFLLMLLAPCMAGERKADYDLLYKHQLNEGIKGLEREFDELALLELTNKTQRSVPDPFATPLSWNPISLCLFSGCFGSGCGGSGCILSGCAGSVCAWCPGSASATSGCAGSACTISGCTGSLCSGSTCVGSGCTGSYCTGSNCSGSSCTGSGCTGSNCVNSTCTASTCTSSYCVGSGCNTSNCTGTACIMSTCQCKKLADGSVVPLDDPAPGEPIEWDPETFDPATFDPWTIDPSEYGGLPEGWDPNTILPIPEEEEEEPVPPGDEPVASLQLLRKAPIQLASMQDDQLKFSSLASGDHFVRYRTPGSNSDTFKKVAVSANVVASIDLPNGAKVLEVMVD